MTSSQWVDKVDQLRQINGWNEQTTIYHMQARLSSLAKTWYYNLKEYNHTWDGWKSLLVKPFPNQSDFALTLKKLVNRTKEKRETWTQYYFAR